jgi:hypothetical protein
MIFGRIKSVINKSPNEFKSTVRLSSGKWIKKLKT